MADVNNRDDERIDTTTPAREDDRPALADGFTLNEVRDESRTEDARRAFSGQSDPSQTGASFETQAQNLPAVTPQSYDNEHINGVSNGHANGHELKSQVKEKAGQVMHKAGETIKTQLGSQKERAAEGLDSLTQAFHQTGDALRENGQSQVGQYAESFASQMDRFTSYLREKDIDDITREVSDYARKNPAVFLGGAFLAGVALSRFLKSSGGAVTPSSATAYGRDY